MAKKAYYIDSAAKYLEWVEKSTIDEQKKSKLRLLDHTPLHDRVIIKPDFAETRTSGGIIIPETAQEKPQKGTIVAVGTGKQLLNPANQSQIIGIEKMTVSQGDKVVYNKYSGVKVEIDGDEYIIMREGELLFKV